jgi:hypothetical protein
VSSLSLEAERVIWSSGLVNVIMDGKRGPGEVRLAETFVMAYQNLGSRRVVALADITEIKGGVSQGRFKKSKFVTVSTKSGDPIEFEVQDDPVQEAEKLTRYFSDTKQLAERQQIHMREIEETRMPLTCEFSFNRNELVESLRQKNNNPKKNEAVSSMRVLYFPFAQVVLHGPPHVTPRTLLVRLALPMPCVSYLVHQGRGGYATQALLDLVLPLSVPIPLPRRLVALNRPPDGAIVVPQDVVAEENIGTVMTNSLGILDRALVEYESKFNEEAQKYNASSTSLGRGIHGSGMRGAKNMYETHANVASAAYNQRFFSEPVERIEVVRKFFLPHLYVELALGGRSSTRRLLLNWQGVDVLSDYAEGNTELSMDGLNQVLADGMYQGTREVYYGWMKSLISESKFDEARGLYDEAVRLYPSILTGTFEDLLGEARASFPPQHAPEKDYWSVLGLQPGAGKEIVEAVYRELVKQYHPDRLPPGATDAMRKLVDDKMKEINQAYQQLESQFKQ